ncbi:MAG: hypothetical protein BGO31_10355 [Bacteroidetes bacterium 43-16]|nr:MAG: hypothetical protein BGO31_10355 [Bacteroidetes bacterium 43-16]
MANEIELKFLFWVGTFMMLALAVTLILITLLYHKRVYSMREKEAENLLKATLEVEQKERRRIASDFHDGVNGDLNAITNYISLLYTKEEDSFKQSLLQEVKHTLDHTKENIQMISYNLMPPLLDTLGLIAVLKDFFVKYRKWSKIFVEDQYLQEYITLTQTEAYELYRIIQELFNNMFKHGKISQVNFAMSESEQIVKVTISDDGTFFDFHQHLKSSKGIGLKSITTRLKQIGAHLEQLQAEKGNTIILTLKKAS